MKKIFKKSIKFLIIPMVLCIGFFVYSGIVKSAAWFTEQVARDHDRGVYKNVSYRKQLKDNDTGDTVPAAYSYFRLGKPASGTNLSVSGRVGSLNGVSVTTEIDKYADLEGTIADSNNHGTASFATDDIKGNFAVTYKNASYYYESDDEKVMLDVRLTAMDFTPETSADDLTAARSRYDNATLLKPIVYFIHPSEGIGVNVLNLKWITVKVEFLKAGTNTLVKNLKGNTTYWDIDLHQGIRMNGSTNKGIYIKDNTNKLFFTSVTTSAGNTYKYIYDDQYSLRNIGTEQNPINQYLPINQTEGGAQYAFTEAFDTGDAGYISRTFTFQRNYDLNGTASTSHTGKTSRGGIAFSSSPTTFIALPDPKKSVNKTNVGINEEYIYTITQRVPSNGNNFLDSFVMQDTLANCLNVDTSKVKVYNGSTDVTSKFTITNSGQTIKVTAKTAELNQDDFYSKIYTFKITTKIKSNYNLSNWADSSKAGRYKIPNEASVTYKIPGKTAVTNSTNEVNVYHQSIILNNPTKSVDKTNLAINEEYTYSITQVVPANSSSYLSSFIMQDTLENCLNVDTSKVKVYNGSTDVTSKFTITNNGQTIKATATSTALNNDAFYNKTYTFKITTKIKNNYSLANWRDSSKEGRYKIPNKASVTYQNPSDSKSTTNETNEVPVYHQLDITLPKPTKSVNKQNIGLGEDYTYTITQKIPAAYPDTYLKNLVIEDTLDSVLNAYSKAEIEALQNDDVTNNFTVSVSGQTVKFTAKNLDNTSFYNKTYTFKIKTKLNTVPANSYKPSGLDVYRIPNSVTTKYQVKGMTNPNLTDGPVHVYYIPIEAPEKNVKNKAENKDLNNQYIGIGAENEYVYTIEEYIPKSIDTYLEKFVLTDTLEPCLNVDRTKIKVYSGTTEVNYFTIGGTGNTVIFTANALTNASFYGKKYTFKIPTYLKVDANLSGKDLFGNKYEFAEGNYKIPNQASLTYKIADITQKTEKTEIKNVKYKLEDPIKKTPTKIINNGIKVVDLGEINSYTYTIEQEVPRTVDKYLKSFKMEDVLEVVLNADKTKVKVLDKDNKDVTEKFEIKQDVQKLTVEAKTEELSKWDFYGGEPTNQNNTTPVSQTYKFQITTYIKNDANLEPYRKNDTYLIPNQGKIVYEVKASDPKEEPTNEVEIEHKLDIDLPKPIKEVNTKKVKPGEPYSYIIKQEIPATTVDTYLEKFILTDTLEPCLDVNTTEITVVNEKNEVVTNRFTITAKNQKIMIEARDTKDKELYGHTFSFIIWTHIKDKADLSKYKEGNKYVIPNFAEVTYKVYGKDEKVGKTEIVNVEYTPEVIKVPDTAANISKIIMFSGIALILGGSYVLIKKYRGKTIKK